MSRPKDVLTTGEVARICNVAPRTVSKWFDTGKLHGYRIPGSKDRRIPRDQLIRFMRAHGIPLNGLETGKVRVLVVESDTGLADALSTGLAGKAGYDVQIARNGFEAGALAAQMLPHAMLVDIAVPGMNGRDPVRSLRSIPDLAHVRLIAMTDGSRAGAAEALRQEGFDGVLARPFDISQAVSLIENGLPAEL